MTLLVVPAAALSEPPPLRAVLRYEVDGAVRGCPTAAELQASIAQQLGYDPFSEPASAGRLEVRVAVARQAGASEARIEWLDERGVTQGERRLGSPDNDCAELGAGIAFAVAVQLQLRAAATAPPATAPPPDPPPEPPPPLASERRKPAPPAASRAEPRSSLSVLAGAGGLGRAGRQPGVAAGLRAFASIGVNALAFQLDAHATLPTALRDAEGRGFSAREVGLGGAPCFRYRWLDACGLAAVTILSVRGEGVDRPQSPSVVGLGVGARLQLTLPWHDRLAAVIHADALAQLSPQDVLVNRERVWSTAPVGFAVGLDVAAIFR